jgi:hypothetical protein
VKPLAVAFVTVSYPLASLSKIFETPCKYSNSIMRI